MILQGPAKLPPEIAVVKATSVFGVMWGFKYNQAQVVFSLGNPDQLC